MKIASDLLANESSVIISGLKSLKLNRQLLVNHLIHILTGHSVFSGKEKAVNRCSYSQIQSTVKLKLTVGLAIHRQIGQASAYVTV